MSKTISSYADENQRNLYKNFPSTHYLSNPDNVHHVLLWNTFFRRNLHRLATDYLGFKLHFYQVVVFYIAGLYRFIVIIACRAAAKSWIVALLSSCFCIAYPHSEIVLVSATRRAAKLLVSDKIKSKLMGRSPTLRREIDFIRDNQTETIVYFRNGSTITVVAAIDSSRGYRSTVAVREEYRQIEKSADDGIISPFQVMRQPGYMLTEPYCSMKELQEEPIDIYISSSWYDSGHWMWGVADQAFDDMLNGDDSCLFAFDESVVLKYNIKTKKQLIREKKKQDPLTWRMEFLNERVKQNSGAFFSFELLTQNQNLKRPFYPHTLESFKSGKKNPHFIPKQVGEVRVIGCDFAFVENDTSDNSVYSCVRGLPEVMSYYDDDGNEKAIVKQGYRRILPYLESHKGGDTTKQAVRIRQLMDDFQADYIVLDAKNGGIQVFYSLAKTLYDEERGCEYAPLTCMNDDELANNVKIAGAKPVIYVIYGSARLNSNIAFDFRNTLIDKRINFLINFSVAQRELLLDNKEYVETKDDGLKFFYERPFIETQLLIDETSNLLYDKLEQTGLVKIYQASTKKKDRYSSISYTSYFLSLLEKDLFNKASKKRDYSRAPVCVSGISFT